MADVIGLGTGIVEVIRISRMIERHGEQFLLRVYTGAEVRHCQDSPNTTEEFAARWAAKEAVVKALGIRWRGGMSWTDIETCPAGGGCDVRLSGAVREAAEEKRAGRLVLSLAHCRAYATATCLAQGK